MSKKNFKQECIEVIYDLMHSCYDELNLFCEIMGYPKSEANSFIGDDPHGIADIMEGYRYFNMTDIHVLIADYARWLTIYKDNQTLRKVVDEWYYWTLENHDPRKDEWVSVNDGVPYNRPLLFKFSYESWMHGNYEVRTLPNRMVEEAIENGVITHWMPIPTTEKPKYCNLKNWLMGWRPKPEDCLPYYNEHQAQEQAAAQKRVEQAKADLNEAADEFNANKQF